LNNFPNHIRTVLQLQYCPFYNYIKLKKCAAPAPSRRFGPPNEGKVRLHRSARKRLSGLIKALALFLLSSSSA
jgi:hypothetical protein